MKKRRFRVLKAFLITPIVISVIFYILLAWYYKDSFSYGTWINGVYATGKTIDDIDQELLKMNNHSELILLLPDGESALLDLNQMDYQMDYKGPLISLLNQQNPFSWGMNLFNLNGMIIQAKCTYDVGLLDAQLEQLSFFQTAIDGRFDEIKIEKEEDGYQCTFSQESLLNTEEAKRRIEKALLRGESTVNLYDAACYFSYEQTEQDLQTLLLWDKIQELQSFTFTFVFGEQEETIDKRIVSNWIDTDTDGTILLDEDGEILIDESKIDDYMKRISDIYNTLEFPRTYTTFQGNEVTINQGNYGNSFDVEEETAYLKQAFYQNQSESHVVNYSERALYQGADYIGPDYIEVNLSAQKMYVIIGHELFAETDVVTGNVSTGMQTKPRICYIYAKQENRTLRGDGYAAQVDYWMPVYGGVGIHDAKWRSRFGGEIYKRSGSHGCINTPRDIMEQIYEVSFVGMPVIIYNE